MIHDLLEQRVARWLAEAPVAAACVMSFLRRFLPSTAADADQALANGGRLRILIDMQAGTVTRFRVRLLRPVDSECANRTLYSWTPPKND